MAKFETIDEYLAALPEPLREIGDKLRPMLDKALPEATAKLYQGAPTWLVGKSAVCYLKAATAYLTLGFFKASEISDSSGRLESGARGMGQVKLRSVDEVDEKLFGDWLEQARKLESAAS